MELTRVLGDLAAHQFNRFTGTFRDRRHRGTLRRGMLDPGALQRAQGTWWGSDRRWYPGGTPPRRHNRVTPLVDGEQFFAALQEALAGAQHYVYIVGWCLTPHIPLQRHGDDRLALDESRLLEVLREVAQRTPVRILLWSGAPFLLQPTTHTMEQAQQAVEAAAQGADMQCRLDRTAHISHCHHQKTVVVDGRVAFVGGMDLTTFQGDRWDTSAHLLRAGPNWHDVQLRIEGEAVADVEHNFRQRWDAAIGEALPEPAAPVYEPDWELPVQIVRTIARDVYPFAPHGEFGIRHIYTRALRAARRLIYLENQYLWSPDVMDALIAVINQERSEPFRIVIVLPARAYSGKYDNDRHVSMLREADSGRGIVSVYCPYASGPAAGLQPFTYRPIYVHAKVAIIDDEWLMVGSANLNSRGFITDSEMNAVVRDATLARQLRVQLWAEHLGLSYEDVDAADPVALVDREWTARAAENAAIIQQADRPLLCDIHRYEIGHMPGSRLLEELEVLTLEH